MNSVNVKTKLNARDHLSQAQVKHVCTDNNKHQNRKTLEQKYTSTLKYTRITIYINTEKHSNKLQVWHAL